jgi:hypothetical protein
VQPVALTTPATAVRFPQLLSVPPDGVVVRKIVADDDVTTLPHESTICRLG